MLRTLQAACGILLLVSSLNVGAQVRPDLTWRTLRTHHFRIHFNPEMEALARRTAANAEFAYRKLADELVPPRGIVDIVLADNVDYANGYATPYPSNRIVIYARPPVEAMSLRNHVDWNLILVTHELAHVFHLDRTRGWWRIAQAVFGRAAPLFPNTYSPSWMIEGLAVHYETRITGSGRLAGTEFPALVRASALDGKLPSLHEISLAAPRFPGGSVSYVFGSYAMSRGSDDFGIPRFVEAASARPIPWRFAGASDKAWGESFGAHWDRWRDSVLLAMPMDAARAEGTRVLTSHGFEARFPRWLNDTTLIYVANDARQTTGLYRLRDADDARRTRIARRNSIDVNSPAGADARRTVHAELDWTDPYSLRSDLYEGAPGLLGRDRLTRADRLSSPDVHEGTGRVVAIQTEGGSTRVVMIDERGEGLPRQVAAGSLDRTWSEPRWSHDGTRIAAVRWDRGGTARVVVMDTSGRELKAFSPPNQAGRLTIVSSPAWIPGDTTLLFVSDHEGRAMIYRGDVRTGAFARIWSTQTALNTPDVSPDGRRIAAVELGAKGYDVVTRAMPASGEPIDRTSADSIRTDSLTRERDRFIASILQPTDDSAIESRYWAFEQVLMPTWWLPSIHKDDTGNYTYGGLTGSRDVLGRHAWEGTVSYEAERKEWNGELVYSWAGLGNPVFTVFGGQEWRHGRINDVGGSQIGILGQRERSGGLSVLFQRPRVRLTTYAILGGEAEEFRFRTYPDTLILGLPNDDFLRTITTQSVEAEVGFSTMQRPGLAVSVEDGLAMAVTHRRRFGIGLQYEDVTESIMSMSAAKSLPLPGYAKHVFAVRAAYGETGHPTTSAFSVGGISGSRIELLPGVAFGDSRRLFFVRGFEPSSQLGVRAAAASAEYRAPLLLGGRGLSFLPVFFQKAALTGFADAGSAWCSFAVPDSFICPSPVRAREVIASVGAELSLDAALQYDALYRFRLGVARPVRGERFAERATTFYFSLGSTF